MIDDKTREVIEVLETMEESLRLVAAWPQGQGDHAPSQQHWIEQADALRTVLTQLKDLNEMLEEAESISFKNEEVWQFTKGGEWGSSKTARVYPTALSAYKSLKEQP